MKRYYLQFKGTLIIHCLCIVCTNIVQSVYSQCTDNMDLVRHIDTCDLETRHLCIHLT
jgi:hypothetical protein